MNPNEKAVPPQAGDAQVRHQSWVISKLKESPIRCAAHLQAAAEDSMEAFREALRDINTAFPLPVAQIGQAGDDAERLTKQIAEIFVTAHPYRDAMLKITALIRTAMEERERSRLGTTWRDVAQYNLDTATQALALLKDKESENAKLREGLRSVIAHADRLRVADAEDVTADVNAFMDAIAEAERLLIGKE